MQDTLLSAMPGYLGVIFSPSLADNQRCLLCKYALKQPYKNTVSGEICCHSCVKDREDFKDYLFDESKAREMSSLRVVCCNDENHEGTLRYMNEVIKCTIIKQTYLATMGLTTSSSYRKVVSPSPERTLQAM